MHQELVEVARTMACAAGSLGAVYGMRALGILGQYPKDAEGKDYTPLAHIGDADETLAEVIEYLGVIAGKLGNVYVETVRSPGLAVARCPEAMQIVLANLRNALKELDAEGASRYVRSAGEAGEVREDIARNVAYLEALEQRVCPRAQVPAQAGPSAEDVVAAIRRDPAIARAASAALSERED
ncbi:hypothetical protein [Streptomyces sp. NPDC046976]|uniref:hypothetical protein n=1 Tax=Streptomyces sp. NPDC046976 TaxID=3155258 RepID=UPI003406E218